MIRKLLARIFPQYVYRSAINGRFVTKEYARMFPENVIRERVQ